MSSEHYLRLDFGGGNHVDLTPENARLYTHRGGPEVTQYDHVYVEAGTEEDGASIGAYFFRHTDVFPVLKKHLIEHGYTLHLNLPEVAPGDKEVFEELLARDELNDLEGPAGIPTNWTDEAS